MNRTLLKPYKPCHNSTRKLKGASMASCSAKTRCLQAKIVYCVHSGVSSICAYHSDFSVTELLSDTNYRKRRNIGVQKIWRFCLKSGRIKYWQIFNLALRFMFIRARATLILAGFNLAIWWSITKLSNKMYRQYFCVSQYVTCTRHDNKHYTS